MLKKMLLLCMLSRKNFLKACLTSLVSLLFLSFPYSAKAQTFKLTTTQFLNHRSGILKCGYRKGKLTIKNPEDTAFNKPKTPPGNRMEADLDLRCEGYRPPIPLIALLPTSNSGITLAEHPLLFFYIPDANLANTTGELIIYDEKLENIIYRHNFSLNASDSIIAVDISNSRDLPQLEVGKSYFWNFSIIFDPLDRSDSSNVGGWIQRVVANADIKHQLATASPQEQPSIYAAHGLWHETLASLAKLRCTYPNDATLASDWESLLQQVGLSEIARKPLAQCN